MAFYMEMGGETDLKWIFNVNFDVGPGRANRWDDVMLVQHALNAVMASYDLIGAKGNVISAYLKRDGHFGPLTAEAIVGYQKHVRDVRKRQITADGVVSKASHSGWTGKTQTQFTIVHLNRDHRNLHGRMMKEEDFPTKLEDLLKSKQKSA
jgi:hypothetical protein